MEKLKLLFLTIFIGAFGFLSATPIMPNISSGSTEYWYYIEFSQRDWPSGSNNRYLYDLGIDRPLIAVPPANAYGILWKIENTEKTGEYRIVSKRGNSIAYTSSAIAGTDIVAERYYSSWTTTDRYKIESNNTDYYKLTRVGGYSIDKKDANSEFGQYGSGDGVSVTFIPEGSLAIPTDPAFAQNNLPVSQDFGDVTVGLPSDTKTFNLLAYNLTGNVILTASDQFIVEPASITPIDGIVYVPVKITARPTATGAVSTTLEITSNGITTPLSISLTATGTALNLPVELSPTVAPSADDKWYYIYYTKRNGVALHDLGANQDLVAVLPVENEEGQLWKVVSTGISNKYKIINKLGHEITRTGSNFASTATGNNFRFDTRTDGKWQIYCHETGGHIHKNIGSYNFISYNNSSENGSTVEFVKPEDMTFDALQISTDDEEYWYQIKFNGNSSKALQDNGQNQEISQETPVDGQTNQYWKITGSIMNYQLESYNGYQIAKLVVGDASGQHYKTVAKGEGEPHGLFKHTNGGTLSAHWQLMNNVMGRDNTSDIKRYLNNQGGSRVNLYSNDDNGNALIFTTLTAPPAEFSVSADALPFGTVPISLPTSDLQVTVNTRNLTGTVTYEITGSSVFTITPVGSWSNKRGGTLNIAFDTSTEGDYSATLTISADGTIKTIPVTGRASSGPNISATPSSLDFGNVAFGSDSIKPITISGVDLEGDITYTRTGPDQGAFTIAESSWTAADGGTLNITFKPAGIKTYSDTIVISSLNAETRKIVLTGNGVTGFPVVSTVGNEVWYSIEFSQRAWPSTSNNRYLYDLGDNRPLIAVPPANADGILWKIEDTGTTGEYRIISKRRNSIAFTSAAIAGTDIVADRYYSSSTTTTRYKIESVNGSYYKIARVGGNGIDKSGNDNYFDAYGGGAGVSVTFIPEGSLAIPTDPAFAQNNQPASQDFGNVTVNLPSDTKTFNLLAYNLTGNVTLTASDQFIVEPASITPIDGIVYVPVKTTAHPTATGAINATLEITSDGIATPLSIPLIATGTALNLPVELSPNVANSAGDKWYYIRYSNRTDMVLQDVGAGSNLVAAPADSTQAGQLWKAVSTGISGKYRIINQLGNEITYSNKIFASTASSAYNFRFDERTDGKWQIYCHETGGHINKTDSNYFFGSYNSLGDNGNALEFIKSSDMPDATFNFPRLSTEDDEYWYQIQFNRRAADNKVIQDNGLDNELVQAVAANGQTSQYWKFTGKAQDYRIESYAGGQMAKLVGGGDNGPHYKAVAIGESHGAYKFYANNAPTAQWKLWNNVMDRTGSTTGNDRRFLNDLSGQYVNLWSGDDAGNALNFISVPAPPAEFSVETSALPFDMVAVGLGKNLPVTVAARNLSDTIAYAITGADASLFSVDLANSDWSKKRGGALSIAFKPMVVGTYSATLSITAAGTTVAIPLTGTGSTDPYIVVESTSLDFGDVTTEYDSVKSVGITILNLPAGGDFTWTQTGPDAGAFTITESSRTDDAVTLNVVFRPTERRTCSDTIVISSTDAETKKIVLTGAGVTGFPFVSTSERTVWYYVEFSQRSWPSGSDNRYLYDLGVNRPLIAVPPVNANGVLWKIEATETAGEYLIESKRGNSIGYASSAIDGTDIAGDRYYSSNTTTARYKIEPVNGSYYKIVRVGGSGIDKKEDNSEFGQYGSGAGVSVTFISAGSLTSPSTATALTAIPASPLNLGNVRIDIDLEESAKKSFYLFGYNLSENVTYSLSVTGAGEFSVSPASLTPSDGIIYEPVEITVTPADTGAINASLDVTGDRATLAIALSATGETYLPVKLSDENTDEGATWYYLFNRRSRVTGHVFAEDGASTVKQVPVTLANTSEPLPVQLRRANEEGSDNQLWKVVETADQYKYQFINKVTGNKIKIVNNGITTANASDDTFSFIRGAGDNAGASAIYWNKKAGGAEGGKTIVKDETGDTYSLSGNLTASDAGSCVQAVEAAEATDVFAPEKPLLSTYNDEHWYQIQFLNRPGKAFTDNNSALAQSAIAAANAQYWKITGTSHDNCKIESYSGKEIKGAGALYALGARGGGNSFHFEQGDATNLWWQLYNNITTVNGERYLNDKNGTEVTGNVKNDGGAYLVFVPVSLAPEFSVSGGTAINFGTVAANEWTSQTLTVAGRNLSGEISYTVTGSDADAFAVATAETWTAKRGGVLTISFNPTEVKEYSASIEISAPGFAKKTITFTGTGGTAAELPVTISTNDNEVWYYIEVNKRTGQYYSDLGEYKALEIRPAIPGENGLLWKVVSSGVAGKYLLISKNGNQIVYTKDGVNDIAAARFYTSTYSENTYSFAKRSDGAWQIRCNELNSYINKFEPTQQLSNNQFGSYGYLPDNGSSTTFIPASDIQFRLPVFSTNKAPVWYYINFKRQAAKNIQGNGANKDVTQVAKVATNVNQFWRFAGTWDKAKIISYEGLELKLVGSYYQLVAAGAGDTYKLYWNNSSNEVGWRLINNSSTGSNLLINDNSGTRLGPWREDGTGNGFDFVQVPLPLDFVIEATDKVSVTAYNTTLYGNIIFRSTDAATGQLKDIPETGLRVNGVVKVEKTITRNMEYPIGFPFAIKSVSDRYALKSYNGTSNTFETATKIEAGKGYLIRFPVQATVVTFTSTANPTLHNTTSVSAEDGYNLVANPLVINATRPELVEGSGAEAFYLYDYQAKAFTLLDGTAAFTLKPFEAIVTVKNVTPPLYETIGGGTPTGLENIDADDPVVNVKYYDLQGRELERLSVKGVYIVKKIRASKKVDVEKVFYKN
ncbi:MAG: hypothetical protein LBR97_04605 [Dysgonamonadaceae bacterium]|jgi:hypothetical protein|nr:hypothetical protein [Dysgonamonadaceae bacterium]